MLFRKYRVSDLQVTLSRDELLRRSRLLVVDDERPELIDDLKRARFAVDYEPDITNENLDVVERPTYDLIILDFGSVGSAFGPDEGLSLLRHIKRVNPALVVLAYTSKSLGTDHADFYRLADAVLPKDAGIAESMEKIEEGLRKAHSVQNLWSGMLRVANIRPGSLQDYEWQNLFVRGLNSQRKMKELRQRVGEEAGSELAQRAGILLLEKLVEIGIKSAVGA